MKACPVCKTQYPDDANFCPQETCASESGPSRLQPLPVAAPQRFHVLGPLGGGASGEVSRARDGQSGTEVAYKIAAVAALPNPAAVDRAQRELRQLQRAVSEHIARVVEFGKTPDGRLFVVTELCSGQPLDRLIAKGPLPLDRAKAIVAQVGEALLEGQKTGVVHRDVAAKNVLCDAAGGVKVINFSVPRPVSDRIFGVPESLSPEQAEGKPVDQRSNTYSLGAVLYHMLTGEPPFSGSDPKAVAEMHLKSEPRPPSKRRPDAGLGTDVDRVVMKALEKSSSRRHLTLRQFLAEVEGLGAARREAAAQVSPGAVAAAFGGGGASKDAGFAKTMMFGGGDAGPRLPTPPPVVVAPPPPGPASTPRPAPPSSASPLDTLPSAPPIPAVRADAIGPTEPAARTPAPVLVAPPPSPPPSPPAPPAAPPRMHQPSMLYGPTAPPPDPAMWDRLAAAHPQIAAAGLQPPPPPSVPTPPPQSFVTPSTDGPPPRGPTPPPQAAAAAGAAKKKGGRFRETLWFKKGDVEEMVTEAKKKAALSGRETSDELPADDARPLEDRYVDDGSLTSEDRQKFSLRQGGTGAAQTMAPGRVVIPGERMTDQELMSEIGGGKRMKILVAACVVGVALLVVIILSVGGGKKDDKKDGKKSDNTPARIEAKVVATPPPPPPTPTPSTAASPSPAPSPSVKPASKSSRHRSHRSSSRSSGKGGSKSSSTLKKPSPPPPAPANRSKR